MIVHVATGALEAREAHLEIVAGAQWLIGSSKRYRPDDHIEGWLVRLDGGADEREVLDVAELRTLESEILNYSRVLATAGVAGPSLAGARADAFPKTSDIHRCRACRFDPLCTPERARKNAQAELTTSLCEPSLRPRTPTTVGADGA
jgi:hypothetical protein